MFVGSDFKRSNYNYFAHKNPQHIMCQGFKPLSTETYIDRVPIGELACGRYPTQFPSLR